MKAKISALMDGELEDREVPGALEALRQDGETRETWRTYHLIRKYHLIGDAMRDTNPLSADFAARLAARLAAEPTVLAPRRGLRSRPMLAERRWQLLSAAASLAAIGFVSAVYFAPESAAPEPVAKSGAPAQAELVQVAPPEAANDYLLAHQAYSPRVSLQGVAPYVRTVSSDGRGPRR